MKTTSQSFAGLSQDHYKGWAQIKEQLFYERYGRFADKAAIMASKQRMSDQSTLLEIVPGFHEVEHAFHDFLDKEQQILQTSEN